MFQKATILIFATLFMSLVFTSALVEAGQTRFNATITIPSLNSSVSNQYLNITIGNNHTLSPSDYENITAFEVQLFLYEGFSFLNHSNFTKAAFDSTSAFNNSNSSYVKFEAKLEYPAMRLIWSNTTRHGIIPWNLTRNFTMRISVPLKEDSAFVNIRVNHSNGLVESDTMRVTLVQSPINAVVNLRGPANSSIYSSNDVPVQFNVTGDAKQYSCLVFKNETSPFGKEFFPAPAPPNFTVSNNTNTNITVFMPFGAWEWNVKCMPKAAYVAVRTTTGWNVTFNDTGLPASLNSFKIGDIINFTNGLSSHAITITFTPPMYPPYVIVLNSTANLNNSIVIDTSPQFMDPLSQRPPLIGFFTDNTTDQFNSSILGGFGSFGDPRFTPGVFAVANFTVNVTGPARPFFDPGTFFNSSSGGFRFEEGPCAPGAPEPKPPFCFPNASGGVTYNPNDIDFFNDRPDFFMHGFTDCTDPANVNKPDCKIIFNPGAEITGDSTEPNLLFTNSKAFSDKIFIDFGTDEMTNMTLTYYASDSYCGNKVATLVDEGVYFTNGTIIPNSRFKPFHHFELSSIISSNISIIANSTYYYKTDTCDRAGNCVASTSCKNFNSSTTSFASTPVPLNFTIPSGFNFKMNFPNGTIADIGSTNNFANLTNVTMRFQPNNANWGIDLPASAIATASSFDFSNAFKTVSTGGKTLVGMNKTVWDSISQRLGITAINITIVGTSDKLFKCDDNGGNCNDVTAMGNKVLTNTTAGTSTWTIPTTLGFSTYSDAIPSSPATTTTTSSGGGGGGGAVSSTASTYSKTFTALVPGIERSILPAEISKIDSALKEITISVSAQSNGVKITVEKLSEKPSDVSDVSGIAFEYFEIDHENLPDENVEKATLKFEVEKTWVTQNSIDASTIALHRFNDGQWQKLETTLSSSDDDSYNFEAESPGFSTFAIVGDQAQSATASEQEVAPETTGATTTPGTETTGATGPISLDNNTLIIIGVLIAAVIGGVALFFGRKRI